MLEAKSGDTGAGSSMLKLRLREIEEEVRADQGTAQREREESMMGADVELENGMCQLQDRLRRYDDELDSLLDRLPGGSSASSSASADGGYK